MRCFELHDLSQLVKTLGVQGCVLHFSYCQQHQESHMSKSILNVDSYWLVYLKLVYFKRFIFKSVVRELCKLKRKQRT